MLMATKRRLKKRDIALVLILAGALGLRLLWVLHAQTTPARIADPGWYFAVASNLAGGHGFTVDIVGDEWAAGPGGSPTTLWPPGWPLSLAAAFALFGTSLTVAKLLNVIAGVVTIYLVYRIGEMSFGRASGLFGAGLLAFYPNLIFWSSTLYSDIYFTMWFALSIFLLLRTKDWRGREGLVGSSLLGLVVGAAVLTRGQGLMLPLFAFLFWSMFWKWQYAMTRTSILLVAAAVVILPWSVRNVSTFHAPILVSANDGFNLRIGHSPYATGRFVAPHDLWALEPGISYTEREALFSREGRKLAIEYAVGHPLREIELSAKKLYYLIIPDSDALDWANYAPTAVAPAGVRNILTWVSDGYYWSMLLLSIVGLVSFRRLKLVRWMTIVVVTWVAFHVIFFGEPRFHMPLLTLMVLLAAMGVSELRRIWVGGEAQRVPATVRSARKRRR